MQNFSKCSLAIYSLALTCLLFFGGCSSQFFDRNNLNSKQYAESDIQMVVTENKEATDIAIDILEAGGNAFDAAVATSFALSVVRPHSTGIGGGGFFLFKESGDINPQFLDAREKAPRKTQKNSLDQVSIKDSAHKGALVGVPGLTKGLEDIYKKYGSGKLSWSELIEPSIELANSGFPVYPHLSEAIKLATEKAGFSLEPKLIKKGYFINQELAQTLRAISEHGSAALHEGKIAKAIVKATRKHGGVLDENDLINYRAVSRKPASFPYKGFKIHTAPLPSSAGIVLGQILKLRDLQLSKLSNRNPSTELHLLAESMSMAFKERALKLGDPSFTLIDQYNLLSDSHIKKLGRKISLEETKMEKTLSEVEPLPTSTTHFSIIDREGNVVSSTQSINLYFGSGILAESTGIFLNNTLDDFSRPKNKANSFGLVGRNPNYPGPNKIPLSSMSPTIVTANGDPFLVLGSPGGPRIISAVAQTLINRLDYNLNLKDSVAQSRIHKQWQPPTLFLEKGGFPKEVIRSLSSRGQQIKESAYLVGNVSAIGVESNGKLIGVADPRRNGKASSRRPH